MLLLNRYGLGRLVWCMIPGASRRVTRRENQLLSTSHGRSRDNNSVFAQYTEEENPLDYPPSELRPLIVLYLITTLRTVTTVGVLNFLSLHLDQQDFSNIERSAVLSSLYLRVQWAS